MTSHATRPSTRLAFRLASCAAFRPAGAPCAALLATVALVASTGCTSRTQTFEGYSDDQVWSAMVAASRAPEYEDWKVADNEVFIDESGRRIEVQRRLRRLFVSPYSNPRKEDEEWRLQMLLVHDSSLEAPTIEFTARQVTVPAHVWREADRFFAQVRTLLGPAIAPSEEWWAEDHDGVRAPSDGAPRAETLEDDEVPTPPPLPGPE